ncbi:NUDIX domain-containing protein [Candidatus Gracilibacteria bacterium]|nr:NUDIX domain-containing protein [Candidatus Gracilibacteria bacterium]NUJ98569.1 NUDIX domain-containing protein [Candidatus Gracilibacteria bacterium]
MNKVVQEKMKRLIMVIKNDILFSESERKDGFYDNGDSLEQAILNNYEYMMRGEAEVNYNYKQPIPYGIVISQDKKIFVYKRGASGSNAGESRLHSKISFGVGGHIEEKDQENENILLDTLKREIEEEIKIISEDIINISLLGYINDDTNDVGKVHFGISYIIEVKNTNTSLEDGELANGEFLDINEIEEMMQSEDYDVETRSKIIYEPLKNFLEIK